MWKMIVSSTAQMNADQPQALVVSLPKNFPMCRPRAVCHRLPVGGGQDQAVQHERGPKVAMNDGSPSVTTRNPLMKPTNRPKASADDDGQDGREPVVGDQEVHQERRHGEHVAHRQVDLAADQQQHLADGPG